MMKEEKNAFFIRRKIEAFYGYKVSKIRVFGDLIISLFKRIFSDPTDRYVLKSVRKGSIRNGFKGMAF